MKLQEVIRRLQEIYNNWGDVDVCMEIPDDSPQNNQGLIRYGIYDILGMEQPYIKGKRIHNDKIISLMGEEWNWRGKDDEAPLDAPD